MSKKRDNWIERVYKNFIVERNKRPNEIGSTKIGNCIAIIDVKTNKIGIASCSPKDEFDLKTGIAIAWARFLNYTIPDWVINEEEEEQEKLVCIFDLVKGERFKFNNQIYRVEGLDIDGDLVTYNESKCRYQLFFELDGDWAIQIK